MWQRSLVGLMVAVAFCGCGIGTTPSKAPERIILIVVDTLRRDHVSAYSPSVEASIVEAPTVEAPDVEAHRVETPNIDRLAARGQVFRNATSAFHSTTMSMAALFSGRTPSIEFGNAHAALDWNTFASCGMSRFAEDPNRDACVPNSVETLAEDMQAAGYWTAGVVSNKLLFRPYGYDQGFDEWVEVGLAPVSQALTARQSARIRTARHVNTNVVRTLANRPSDRFFLYVHYIDVHDWILFDISYAESVRRFDQRLGELLDALENENLLEGATIVFTSDHGEMLVDHHLDFEISRHYGNPSFEPLLQVPLIVVPGIDREAGEFIRGQDVRGLVRGLAGLEGHPAPALEPGELLVTERFYQTYRKDRWKSMWKRTEDRVLLFDLDADPGEATDLSKEEPEILAAHRKRVDEIVTKISTSDQNEQHLSPEDLDRLRALGYIE
jgi:arylsulfatase A-like enzyme